MVRAAFVLGLVCVLHGSICSHATAQGFNARFDTLSTGWWQVGFAVEENSNGELLVFCGTPRVDSLYASSTVQALRLASNGSLLGVERNHHPFGAAYPGTGNTSDTLPDGRIALSGSTYNADTIFRVAVYWFNSLGDDLGYVEYNLPGNWIGRQLKCTPDGGYVVVGDMEITGQVDGFVMKLDSNAAIQWTQVFGGTQWRDYFLSVSLAPNNGYYVGGRIGLSNFNYDPWCLRLDSTGSVIWSLVYGTPLSDNGSCELVTLADGNLVYGGGRPNGVFSDQWAQLVKVDSLGSVMWDRIYDTPTYYTQFRNVKEVAPGGDLIACGYSYLTNTIDGTMLRTNNQGDSIWMRHYVYYDSLMSDGTGYFHDVIPTSDGGFAAVGTVGASASGNNPPGYTQDIWVVKVDSLGCIEPGCNVPMGVTTQITNLGNALTIAPNPASERVQLTWQLPAALRSKGAAELSIVSAQGMLVRTVPCDLSRGSLELDVQDLAPGVYHLHMVQQGTWISGGKLVVE